MNDLPFIKYKPQLMMLDTFGMTNSAKLAHRQLFDMCIIQDGPHLHNDFALKELASCSVKLWPKVKQELIAKGWQVKNGYFMHKRTIETLNESKREYVANYNRTAPANNKPLLELTEPDDVTGCVTYHVTSASRKPDEARNANHLHLQQHLYSKLTTKGEKALDKADAKKKLPREILDIAMRFEKALAMQWVNDAGKWVNRIKAARTKCERVIAEVESAITEQRIKSSVAQYAEQIWKEFK